MEAKNLVVVQRCQRSGEDVWPNLLQLAVTENELRPGLGPEGIGQYQNYKTVRQRCQYAAAKRPPSRAGTQLELSWNSAGTQLELGLCTRTELACTYCENG
uniref:Uncharacterized protein n=1 Tax=Branchiostoma floridae TaxID=7739 RepID=C3YN52_BRAFL|eukprot:XP_002602146.1 hypothetical protein BRAFLDRAFT_97959 [Branchiostoma floridae]